MLTVKYSVWSIIYSWEYERVNNSHGFNLILKLSYELAAVFEPGK